MNTPSPAASLFDRLGTRLRGGDWRVGAAAAVLLALVPGAVIGAATLDRLATEDRIAARTRRESVALARVAEQERLAAVLNRATLGGTLEELARALPADAALRRVTREADGTLGIEVATLDPDRLRAALRRRPVTAGLRDVGQQGGPAGLIVTLEERP